MAEESREILWQEVVDHPEGAERNGSGARGGHIDRGIRRYLRCRDTCGLLPQGFAIWRWVV